MSSKNKRKKVKGRGTIAAALEQMKLQMRAWAVRNSLINRERKKR